MTTAHIRLLCRPGLESLMDAIAQQVDVASPSSGSLFWYEDGACIEALLTDNAHEAPIPAFIISAADCTQRIRHPDDNPWCASCLADAFPGTPERIQTSPATDAPRRTSARLQLDRTIASETAAQHILQAVRLLTRRLDAARAVLALGQTV